MVELILLKYIINNNDDMLLTQLDGTHFLDTQAKAYLKIIKESKENSESVLTEADLEHRAQTPNIFEDVPDISKAAIHYYVAQLKERFNKFKFYEALYTTLQDDYSFEEVIDEVQTIILSTGKQTETIQDIDCSELQNTSEDFIQRKPLGFGEFDKVNGGLGTSEL